MTKGTYTLIATSNLSRYKIIELFAVAQRAFLMNLPNPYLGSTCTTVHLDKMFQSQGSSSLTKKREQRKAKLYV